MGKEEVLSDEPGGYHQGARHVRIRVRSKCDLLRPPYVLSLLSIGEEPSPIYLWGQAPTPFREASQHIACVKIGGDGPFNSRGGELKEAFKGPIIPSAPPGPGETVGIMFQTSFASTWPYPFLLSLYPWAKK